MTVALLKSAYHTTQEWRNFVKILRESADMYSKKLGTTYPLAIALELRGCEIRTGTLKHVFFFLSLKTHFLHNLPF